MKGRGNNGRKSCVVTTVWKPYAETWWQQDTQEEMHIRSQWESAEFKRDEELSNDGSEAAPVQALSGEHSDSWD